MASGLARNLENKIEEKEMNRLFPFDYILIWAYGLSGMSDVAGGFTVKSFCLFVDDYFAAVISYASNTVLFFKKCVMVFFGAATTEEAVVNGTVASVAVRIVDLLDWVMIGIAILLCGWMRKSGYNPLMIFAIVWATNTLYALMIVSMNDALEVDITFSRGYARLVKFLGRSSHSGLVEGLAASIYAVKLFVWENSGAQFIFFRDRLKVSKKKLIWLLVIASAIQMAVYTPIFIKSYDLFVAGEGKKLLQALKFLRDAAININFS